MTFGLDYDGTFTEDRSLWLSFIANARTRGHLVICVTNRWLRQPLPEADAFNFDAVIYAADRPKRRAAIEAGMTVDVWIDDLPEAIGTALLVGGAP